MPKGVGYPEDEQPLPPELGPQPMTQAAPQQGGGLREQLAPQMTGDPVEAFLVEVMSIADEAGILDEVSGGGGVEGELDAVGGVDDMMEFVNEAQLTKLVQMFEQIPPEQRSQLEAAMRESFPPAIVQRLDAFVRLLRQRGSQVQAPEQEIADEL